MAAYFHSSAETQAGDGLHTLYIRNPNYLPYSDTSNTTQTLTNTNTFFLNSPLGNALNTIPQPHAPPPNTPPPFIGIPLPGPPATSGFRTSATTATNATATITLHEISALQGFDPKLRPNMWGSLDTSQIVPQSPTRHQTLSLSLSTQQQQQQQQRQGSFSDGHVPALISPPGASADRSRVIGSSSGAVSNPVSVFLLSSKYLSAAQELFDEVVRLGREVRTDLAEGSDKEKMKLNKASGSASAGETSTAGGANSSGSRAAELTPVQRQELQVKKAKLVSMLDEVEQKYRQYHDQMQLVITSFEQAAGFGSAKPYTDLALQTISKQFRTLKDAISGQIRLASKSLGDEMEGSRLRYIDNHIRRQRALHQMGVVQHNAWRPHRGLPERAVSVLRAWLFEHFLHPYPKDSDKHMLAKQTGLSRGQVSNWFINARVRLWKPMVEEMYLEETKNQEHGSSDNSTSRTKKSLNIEPTQAASKPISQENDFLEMDKLDKSANPSISRLSEIEGNGVITQPFIIHDSDISMPCSSPPSPSSILSTDMDTKTPSDQASRDHHHFHQLSGGNFGVYSSFTPEIVQSYGNNSNVSLTLGLPCETASSSLSPTQQSFISGHHQGFHLGKRFDIGHGEAGLYELGRSAKYESIDFAQNRKRLAAHLLPDYVT